VENFNIKQCQHFYWLGQDLKERADYSGAIEAFKSYSQYLKNTDKHIPHQWISGLYEKLGNEEASLFHLEKFVAGCSPPFAIKIYKEMADRYLKLEQPDMALVNLQKAYDINPNCGVSNKIDALSKMVRK